MNHLEKTLAVIDAQAKGGYVAYAPFADGRKVELNHGILSDDGGFDWHVLLIFLDSQGAKAAYGEGRKETALYSKLADGSYQATSDWEWCIAMRMILYAWYCEEGNNWKAAIDTAYDLLP